jgi:hypothetical protein
MKRSSVFVILLGLISLAYIGCGSKGGGGGEFHPESLSLVNPDDFVERIDNPYLPLVPGTTFTYQGEIEGSPEVDEVSVTQETKEILGVTCTVVKDRVTINGELAEETEDWFAQDKKGNVRYFGEDSKEFENGVVVSTEGSWEAGVNGAKPGIVMEDQPKVGDSYRQEFAKDVAEDMAEVLSLTESVTVPYGSFTNCLETKEWSPLEPGVVEHKFYAAGIGLLSEVTVEGGTDHMELVSITP